MDQKPNLEFEDWQYLQILISMSLVSLSRWSVKVKIWSSRWRDSEHFCWDGNWHSSPRPILPLKMANLAMNELIMPLALIRFILFPCSFVFTSLSFSKISVRYAISNLRSLNAWLNSRPQESRNSSLFRTIQKIAANTFLLKATSQSCVGATAQIPHHFRGTVVGRDGHSGHWLLSYLPH